MRVIKLERDIVFRYDDIPYQIKYHKQSRMKVGDMLILLEGEYKLSHSIDVKVLPTPPKATFIIQEIRYKSWLHKLFMGFMNNPIEWIEIRCLAVME